MSMPYLIIFSNAIRNVCNTCRSIYFFFMRKSQLKTECFFLLTSNINANVKNPRKLLKPDDELNNESRCSWILGSIKR